MVRAVYLTCGDTDEAADVVDEAFTTVFRLISRRSPVENLRGYLWRSVLNGSKRARERQRLHVEVGDLAARREPRATSGPEELGHDDDLTASMARLDAATRAVLILRFHGDFTVAQIAAHQGLPLGTVKSMIHRGIAALRRDLLANAGARR